MEKKLKVIIDADACPVWKYAVQICQKYEINCILVCDTSHTFSEELNVVYVDQGSDIADYKIVELVNQGDIVVTQDYGLASMILAKKAFVINQNGLYYTDDNILSMLQSRAISAKLRKHKTHLKGPKKRTDDMDITFCNKFTELILKNININ